MYVCAYFKNSELTWTDIPDPVFTSCVALSELFSLSLSLSFLSYQMGIIILPTPQVNYMN